MAKDVVSMERALAETLDSMLSLRSAIDEFYRSDRLTSVSASLGVQDIWLIQKCICYTMMSISCAKVKKAEANIEAIKEAFNG